MAAFGRINVFYSYAHGDEQYRDRLVHHLGALREEGVISDWHDRMIKPGSDWRREIERNLEQAHVVLFLISPAFMRSQYCMGVEVKQAVDLHWKRRCHIVPVIVRPAPEWMRTPFGSFQALPRDARAISTWDAPEAAFADVSQGIRSVCKEIVDWENPLRRSDLGDWIETENTTTVSGFPRIVSRARSVITGKDDDVATLTVTGRCSGQQLRVQVHFALDAPIEDRIGNYLKQLGETIPSNAQFYREETGRGEQKLLVGGHPYYCQWEGSTATWEEPDARVTMSTKVWRCIDVPVDGVVKEERVIRTDTGQEMCRTSIILIACGRGTA